MSERFEAIYQAALAGTPASLTFEAEGEILLKDGTVAATAHGKYVKMPLAKIASEVENLEDLLRDAEDPASFLEELEIPERDGKTI